MSEYKIAIKIAGQLESSFNSAISGAQQGLSSLGGVGKAFGSVVAGSVKVAAGALTATGAALAGVGAASVGVGKDFESAMSAAAATAGASQEEYEKLEKAAMEMGRTTSKTATESANALEYMALAGWDVDTSVAALPSILKMSEATGLDLARTSDLVTDSMSALGVTTDRLPEYLDVVAKAQNKSNQKAEDLMDAYIGVGGVMNNLGVPITESATALGVLANRGIKGSEAGTALTAIMNNLTTGTGQAGKMMESLGISAFDSEGNFIGLEATLQTLNQAMEGMTDDERNATLAAIGGKTHVDALNDLMSGLNTTLEDGRTEWDALQDDLENSTGAMETMRDVKLDNLAGDIATLGSAAQDAGIKIYKHLSSSLRNAAQYGTQQIYRLSDALQEGGFAGVAAEIGPMIAENLQMAVEGLPEIMSEVGGVADAFFEGLTANSGSIGESAATIVSNIVQEFMNYYGDFYSTALYLINGFMLGLTNQIDDISSTFGSMIDTISASVDENLTPIIDSAANIITGLINGLTDNLPRLLSLGITIVSKLSEGVRDHAAEIGRSVVNLMAALGTGIIDHAPTLANAGLNIVSGIVDAITTNLPTLVDSAGDIVDKICTGLDEALTEGSDFLTKAGEIITKLGNSIVENAPKLIETGIKLLGALAKGVLTGVSLVIQNIPAIINGIIDVISSVDWIGLGAQLMQNIIDGIKSLGSAVIQAAKEIFEELMHLGENTEYTSRDITGYTQTNDGRYTNDNGENYYTLEDLVGQGNTEAMAIAAQMAQEAGAATGEAYGEGLEGAQQDAATAARETAKAGFDNLKIDETSAMEAGLGTGQAMASGLAAGEGEMTAQASETASNTAKAYGDGFEGSYSEIDDQVNALIQETMQNAAETTESSAQGIEGAMGSVGAALESGAAVVPEAVVEATTNASEAFSELSTELSTTGTDVSTVFTELSTQIATTSTEIGTAISTLGTNLGTTFTEMGTQATTASETIRSTFTESLLYVAAAALVMKASAVNAFTEMQTGIQTSMTMSAAVVIASISMMSASVGPGMDTMAAAVTTAMSIMTTDVATGMALMAAAIVAGMALSRSAVQSGMAGIRSIVSSGMAACVAIVAAGMAAIVAAISSGCSQAVGIVQSTASSIQSAFASINLSSTGSNIMQGLINGLESRRAQAIETARSIAAAAAQAANAGAQVKSPSRLTTKTGRYIGEGLVVGMKSMRNAVEQGAMSNMVQPVINGASQIRSFEAPDFSRSGIISDTINSFSGDGNGSGTGTRSEASPTFVFSPTYHFEGEAPSKSDLVEANRISQSEFEKMMRDYLRKNKRVAFV